MNFRISKRNLVIVSLIIILTVILIPILVISWFFIASFINSKEYSGSYLEFKEKYSQQIGFKTKDVGIEDFNELLISQGFVCSNEFRNGTVIDAKWFEGQREKSNLKTNYISGKPYNVCRKTIGGIPCSVDLKIYAILENNIIKDIVLDNYNTSCL